MMKTESEIRASHAQIRMTIKTARCEDSYTKTVEMPVDLHELAGDGKAKITLSFDLSNKNYGNGASVMCSISLTVNQDADTISQAFLLARAVCSEEAERALGDAQEIANAQQQQRGR